MLYYFPMKVQIKDFLTKQPNFLVSALVLAYEEEFDPLIEGLGEALALREIRELQARLGLIRVYGAHEFPIGIHNGHILKSSAHVAAAIVNKSDHFIAQERTIPTEVTVYDKKWLSRLSKENQKKVLAKNEELLQDRPVKAADSSPSREVLSSPAK